ncbi:MAG: GNAT family N-acetyltransferase [Cyanobacteria bacterium P01_C01_bin.120]
MEFAIAGYALRRGRNTDRALLIEFLSQTYQETGTAQNYRHLAQTVDQHFSASQTPLWWVDKIAAPSRPIGYLWLGTAIDQQQGDRHSYILALYVAPECRRQGIATALLQQAQVWAQAKGDRQIGLQVFANNPGAIALYRKLGYRTHSLWLMKSLISGD